MPLSANAGPAAASGGITATTAVTFIRNYWAILEFGSSNVAELLALREKTVNFWQCRFDIGTSKTTEARIPTPSRVHGTPPHRDELRPAISAQLDNEAKTKPFTPQLVDNFVDSSFSSNWPTLGRPRGGVAR